MHIRIAFSTVCFLNPLLDHLVHLSCIQGAPVWSEQSCGGSGEPYIGFGIFDQIFGMNKCIFLSLVRDFGRLCILLAVTSPEQHSDNVPVV